MPSEISNAPMTTVALVAIAAIVPALLLMAPVVAGQLATELQMGPAAIGQLFTAELGAMSLATLPGFYWLSRTNWRLAGSVSALLFILANIFSALVDSPVQLTLLRILSGLGGGSLMIICMATASMLPKPDRAYGLWVMGQLALGAVGLSLLPILFAHFGLSAFFIALAALMLLSTPLIGYLPTGKQVPVDQPSAKTGTPLTRPALLGLLAVLLFYVSLNGVWTFIGAIAGAASIDSQTSGNVLAIASLFGIAGAVTATLLGGRNRYNRPLLIGYLIMIVGILLLTGAPDSIRFTVAALGFKYAWTFALPFILASLASIDRNGHVMSLTNLVIGGGLALGPLIAGQMIEALGGYMEVLLGSALLATTSLLLMLFIQPKRLSNPGVAQNA
ncbi:MFS transporter [Marinobacterium sp. D7]|nr:MFS transporter [Marinobacterium ramblicola]